MPDQNCIAASLPHRRVSAGGMRARSMTCPRCCGSVATCACTTCRRCSTPPRADGEVLACYVLDPRLKATSGPRRLQYLYDSLRELRDGARRPTAGHRGAARDANPRAGQEDRRDVGARVGRLLPLRHAPRRRGPRGAGRRAARGVGFAVPGVPGPGHQGRRHALQGVHAVLLGVDASTAGARPRRPGAKSAHVDRPGRRRRAVSTFPQATPNSTCPPARPRRARRGRSSSRPTRGRLRRRPQPARPRRHQPDVGAPQVRHHPPAHHGRRPRQRQGRAGLSARAGVPRLLRAACCYDWPDSAWWNWNKAFDRIEVDEDADAKKRFEAWKAGRTGFPDRRRRHAPARRDRASCTTGCG